MYKYNKEKLGNKSLVSAKVLIQHVTKIIDVNSAIDIGCGIGTFVDVLKQYGIEDSIGLDGEWSEIANIKWNLDDGVYISDRKYDLAICLEVAEHVKKENELNVVETLVGLSDVILFSAAIPKQGGQGHVNERWPSYWRELFLRYGYDFVDVIRPIIWNNDNVFRWYRQNTFIVAKKHRIAQIYERANALKLGNQMFDVVHPDYWISSKR